MRIHSLTSTCVSNKHCHCQNLLSVLLVSVCDDVNSEYPPDTGITGSHLFNCSVIMEQDYKITATLCILLL